MIRLAIITQGLAPGMWAVVSKVVSWEWMEDSGRVSWEVETILPPNVITSAIPSVLSIEPVVSDHANLSGRKTSVRAGARRKRDLSAAAVVV